MEVHCHALKCIIIIWHTSTSLLKCKCITAFLSFLWWRIYEIKLVCMYSNCASNTFHTNLMTEIIFILWRKILKTHNVLFSQWWLFCPFTSILICLIIILSSFILLTYYYHIHLKEWSIFNGTMFTFLFFNQEHINLLSNHFMLHNTISYPYNGMLGQNMMGFEPKILSSWCKKKNSLSYPLVRWSLNSPFHPQSMTLYIVQNEVHPWAFIISLLCYIEKT